MKTETFEKINDKLTEINQLISGLNVYLLKEIDDLIQKNQILAEEKSNAVYRYRQLESIKNTLEIKNNELIVTNKALGKANINISNLYVKLEELKNSLEDKNEELLVSNKALGKANAHVTNLYVELETLKNEIENKNKLLTKANNEITHINAITRIVNSTLNIDSIMESVIQSIKEVCMVDGVVIQLYNKETHSLKNYKYYGEKDIKDLKKWNIHVDEDSVFVDVFKKKEVYYDFNANPDNYYSMEDKKFIEIIKCKNFICFPLEVQEEVIGLIILFCLQEQSAQFDASNLKYLSSIMLNISTAINNAVLYEDLKRTKIELAETKKISRLTKVFEKFVPKQFLSRIAKDGIEKIEFGYSVREEITILFSDIRNFTAMAEKMTPADLLRFMNDYFKLMNNIIHTKNGFVDKFIGDAIMALFEHNHSNAENRAIDAAINMQSSLQEFNKLAIHEKYPIKIGIGIHTGEVILGTVGSVQRMDSTVLGDTVNLASRLESLTKRYHVKIIISENVLKKLENIDQYYYRPLGFTKVKGRKRLVSVFEIFNNDEDKVIDLKQKTKPYLEEAIKNLKINAIPEAITDIERSLEIYPDDHSIIAFLKHIKSKQ